METEIVYRPLADLRPYAGNARTHSRKQIKQIAKSITRFGFTNPVLLSDDDEIIAGHGRVLAAAQIGMASVPAIRLSHLSAAERRAYILADNKLALNAGWDQDLLAIELQALIDLDFDLELTGFSLAEIDFNLNAATLGKPDMPRALEDETPTAAGPAISRSGDVWQLGRHRLLCGDARKKADYDHLLAGDTVDLIFTDPPYNVPIDGHVCGSGAIHHREFAMGTGEMSVDGFTAFLTQTLGFAASHCRNGAIAFVCMDWRHMRELLAAGYAVFHELKNLCVWNKTNGGMGSFYRSKHELIFVFKKGSAEHVNSFGLGDTGRYRTNVWDYAGISSMGSARMEELAMHPTVKPVALVADAIQDCSRRGDIVLDAFGGSGTTLIAAEKVGRSARLIEFDPLYCDTIVRRFEKMMGKSALLMPDDMSFEMVGERRLEEALQ
ncbi:DNA methyltransferase [Sphingobium sp. AN641]|uniref:site-specific DNA-methyltransferase n=1 Tax=Sphingobium sp. AN641 TaxID=3133443 RepID=UPI0030C0EA64